MNIINILEAALTPIIGGIVAYIAYQQYNLNKLQVKYANKLEEDKLKLELYNRRYKIFRITKDLLLDILKERNNFIDGINNSTSFAPVRIDPKYIYNYIDECREAKFLFGQDISNLQHQLLKEIAPLFGIIIDKDLSGKESTEIDFYKDPYQFSNDDEKTKVIEAIEEKFDWITGQIVEIEDEFMDYLSLNNIGSNITT